ncbi:MAG TPA: BON domain-containing protein [Vicinamibacterales bacterium]|nr:BON domain-containing protein [Vicinamibacterales bacterium]
MTRETINSVRRSDAEIFGDARLALDRASGVPGTVHVHVNQGIATLTGTVHKVFELTQAEDAVRKVAGVTRVVNELNVVETINPEGFETPDPRG